MERSAWARLLIELAVALLAVAVVLTVFADLWIVRPVATLTEGDPLQSQAVHAVLDQLPAPAVAPASPPVTDGRNAAQGCLPHAPIATPKVIFSAANGFGAPPPNVVALTFDDGPTPYSTPAILTYLEQTHTPATFFVEGSYARLWPYLIQREWNDGFALGIHTWNHPDMTRQPEVGLHTQLGATLDQLHTVLGANACLWFWRPPYGAFNGHVVQVAQGYGLTTVMWDDDPRDWARPGAQAIAARVLAEAHPGAIILLHDGPALREQTADALPTILAGLRARGLTPVTLPTLLGLMGGPHSNGLSQGNVPQPTPTVIPTPQPPGTRRDH